MPARYRAREVQNPPGNGLPGAIDLPTAAEGTYCFAACFLKFRHLIRISSLACFATCHGTLQFSLWNTSMCSHHAVRRNDNWETDIYPLHIILAFNLITVICILAGGATLQGSDVATVDGRQGRQFNFAGISGAFIALGLMSGLASLFV